MEKKTKEQKITTRYPFDLLDSLRKLAQDHNRSFNGEVIWALREYVAQQQKKKEGQR